MCGLAVAPLDVEWRGINADCDRGWPVGAHLTIFVVEAFQLQLKVGSVHECVVDCFSELKHVVTDCKVVFQSEGRQYNPVSDWKG